VFLLLFGCGCFLFVVVVFVCFWWFVMGGVACLCGVVFVSSFVVVVFSGFWVCFLVWSCFVGLLGVGGVLFKWFYGFDRRHRVVLMWMRGC
jgi:hypothetical protein